MFHAMASRTPNPDGSFEIRGAVFVVEGQMYLGVYVPSFLPWNHESADSKTEWVEPSIYLVPSRYASGETIHVTPGQEVEVNMGVWTYDTSFRDTVSGARRLLFIETM